MSGEGDGARAPWWLWWVCAPILLSLTAVGFAVLRHQPEPAPDTRGPATAPDSALRARWTDGQGSVSANGVARGRVEVMGEVGPRADLQVTLANATFVSIPGVCLTSVAKLRRSWLTGEARTLHCTLPQTADAAAVVIDFTALADDHPENLVGGTASLEGTSARLADRPVSVGVEPEARRLRLLSAPDFTNADIADLSLGDTDFGPTDANGINDVYRRSLDTVLDDWASKSPDDVLVAGDLVDGHWGRDTGDRKMFGPVGNLPQRRTAVTRAAAVYYPQWAERFRAHGLDVVHPAMGDHEYGDNYWPKWKLDLFSTYQHAWATQFTKRQDGSARYRQRPRGSMHEFSAYAWRPRPDVQMVTLDEFTRTDTGMRLRIDRQQQAWLVQVLQQARADDVSWILVQGHLPILGPVREGASSGLTYEGGSGSTLWRTFEKYGVDVYLSGEVHDVTAIQRGGVLQLTHGGIFQFGRLNYLIADVYANHLDLKVFDYDFRRVGSDTLWESRHLIPAGVVYDPDPGIIGTGQLWRSGRLARLSGAMSPYVP